MLGKEIKLCTLKKEEKRDYLEIGIESWLNKRLGKAVISQEINNFFKKGDLKNGICLTFKLDSKIIGVAFMIERKHDLEGVNIFNIAIRPNHQKKGFGLQMMKLLYEKAKKYNKKWVFISTNEKTAIFYKKSGMVEFGRITKARNNLDRVYLCKKLLLEKERK